MKIITVSKAVIVDSDQEMLILRRSKTHPTLALQADLPGGIIDEHEEPGEALVREVFEETGLKITKVDSQLVYAGTVVHPDHASHVRLIYVVRLNERQPQVNLSWEHDQFEWRPLTELQDIEKDYRSFYTEALEYIRLNQIL